MILDVALGIVLGVALLYGLWFVLALVCAAFGSIGDRRAKKHHEDPAIEALKQEADDEEREEMGRREGWTRRR